MKVLVAEDERVSRLMLERFLTRAGYDVEVASDGSDALSALERSDGPQLALVNWLMPGLDGVEVCRRMRSQPIDNGRYVYMLMLTARDRMNDLARAMTAGVDDYVTKPYDLTEVRARLRAGERVLALQSALIESHQRLRALTTLDPLTKLPNRTAVMAALSNELSRSQREQTSVAVLSCDIDRLRHVRELHGPQAADILLQHIASSIKEAIRPYDVLGRFSGDGLIAILPRCDTDGGVGAAERLRALVAKRPIDVARAAVEVTMSVGVASNAEAPMAAAEKLVEAAELALYRAKHRGKNRVERGTVEEAKPR